MSEVFHWVIFVLHFAAALLIMGAIWFRCDPGVWATHLYVDTYEVQVNSSGLWWDQRDAAEVAECSIANNSGSRKCFEADLPLYERKAPDLGWQIFALLGHFEWISATFAFFYIKARWHKSSWWICCLSVLAGTVIYMPFRGPVFINQVVLQLISMVVCWYVFYGYRDVHREGPAASSDVSGDLVFKTSLVFRGGLSGQDNLVPSKLADAHLPALRYCEYCITASELWVAVLSVYVQDAPAFMSLGGYALILLTNLYGILLHYSLVSDNMTGTLQAEAPLLPRQSSLLATGRRRGLRVPASMTGGGPGTYLRLGMDDFKYLMRRKVWGSYIASNTSTLLNSWLAYLVAMGIIFYQQTFLFSGEPPAFVVFAGWSLVVTYSSFGLWMTVVYWYPEHAHKFFFWVKDRDTYVVALYGLDVLSLAAKLAIVGSLSYGFIFRAEGRC